MRRFIILALTIMLFATTSVANAAVETLTYDLTGPVGSAASYSVDPVAHYIPPNGVTVTAETIGKLGGTVQTSWAADVSRNSTGMGVISHTGFLGAGTLLPNSGQIETEFADPFLGGATYVERLLMAFTSDIVLHAITITPDSVPPGGNIQMDLGLNGGPGLLIMPPPIPDIPTSTIIYNFDPNPLVFASELGGQPIIDELKFTNVSAAPFRVQSIEIDYTLLPGQAPIPEPASIIVWSLLGMSFMGLSVFRRRRRGAA